MKRILATLTLILIATACTDKREAQINEKLKSDAQAELIKGLGKSTFTEGYVKHFVNSMKVKLQSYDEATKVATVELTSMNKEANNGITMVAMFKGEGGKLPYEDVVKLFEKETKRSIASFEPNVTTLKCQFEEKDGKEVVKSCK